MTNENGLSWKALPLDGSHTEYKFKLIIAYLYIAALKLIIAQFLMASKLLYPIYEPFFATMLIFDKDINF